MSKLKISLTCSELCKEKVDTDFIFGTMTKDTMSRYFNFHIYEIWFDLN